MSISLNNEKGKIEIDAQAIAAIAGMAAVDSYGIVGMSSRHSIKDGITELLKKENFSRGIEVETDDNGKLNITLHIVVAYGMSISQVAVNAQEKVKYVLEEQIGIHVNEVNVVVQGVKVLTE